MNNTYINYKEKKIEKLISWQRLLLEIIAKHRAMISREKNKQLIEYLEERIIICKQELKRYQQKIKELQEMYT